MGDLGSIPGLERSPGEGISYPLQFSGLENSMNCIVHGVTKMFGEGTGSPLQYSCLETPHGQRTLASYSPWGHKELDTLKQLNTVFIKEPAVIIL